MKRPTAAQKREYADAQALRQMAAEALAAMAPHVMIDAVVEEIIRRKKSKWIDETNLRELSRFADRAADEMERENR